MGWLEQARVEAGRTTQGDSLEPDYSLAFPSGSGIGPRVARVEATDSGIGMSQGATAVGESGPFAPAAASGLDVKSGQESGHATVELRATDNVATATEGAVGGDDPSAISTAGPITGGGPESAGSRPGFVLSSGGHAIAGD